MNPTTQQSEPLSRQITVIALPDMLKHFATEPCWAKLVALALILACFTVLVWGAVILMNTPLNHLKGLFF